MSKLSLAEVELPSGQHFEHHTVIVPAAAMAVVISDDGQNVLLRWRHRFVPDVWNYELPGGLIETVALRHIESSLGLLPCLAQRPCVQQGQRQVRVQARGRTYRVTLTGPGSRQRANGFWITKACQAVSPLRRGRPLGS